MLSLGIDIGGSSVKVALLREGECLATGRSPRYETPDRAALVGAIRQSAAGMHEGPRISPDCIGLCAPGLLDRPTLTIVKAVNVPGIVGVRLPELLVEALGPALAAPRMLVTTDAHATAFDIFSAERLRGRLLCLALGTGVGASVLDDGVPLHVSGETPGHLGHIDVSLDDDPPAGHDGAKGTLESYIGLRALLASGAVSLAPSSDPSLNPDRAGAALLALARGIRTAHAIYRPQHIRLAGGVGVRLAEALPRLRSLIDPGLTSLAREGWSLACARDDFHAARGVAMLSSAELGN